MEFEAGDRWKQLAEKQWSNITSQPRKVRPDVVKNEIWDVLEEDGFDLRSLSILENLQLLEKYISI